MIEIKVTSNFQELNRGLRLLGESGIPYALAAASAKTAVKVRTMLLLQMGKDLERPTPVTEKSLYLKAGNKTKPAARVWFKDSFNSGIPADKYLGPQVEGGARGPKRFEAALRARGILGGAQWAIPAKDILNQYGNMPGALAVKILSALGAAETKAGVTANASSSRKSRKKGNARKYFVAKIRNTQAIWEAKNLRGFGRGIRPVVIFVNKTPNYGKRYQFFEIAQGVVDRNYLDELITAIDKAAAKTGAR
jgi:hypothetical protein